MHYYVYKHYQAPSSVALIISFKPHIVGDSNYTHLKDLKIIHDEVGYLGGTYEDVLDKFGSLENRKVMDEHGALKEIFK